MNIKMRLKRYIALCCSLFLVLFNLNSYIVVNANTLNNTNVNDEIYVATSSNTRIADEFYFDSTFEGYRIILQADKNVVPPDTVVKIKKVENLNGESINQIVSSNATYDDGKILDIVAFDISLWLNGIEIQPENGNVNVSIEPLLKNNEGEDSVAEVFHVTEDGDVSKITADSLDNGKINFAAEHFSVYGFAMLRAAGGHTQAEAEAWIDSMHGTAIDYVGNNDGVQCVDLIALYYQYLGYNIHNYVAGNGYAYTYNYSPLPPGWQRFSNNVDPRPGDIVVFGIYEYGMRQFGHVGIVRAVDSTSYKFLDYNGRGNYDAGTWRWKPLRNFTSIIRPNFVIPPSIPDHIPGPVGGSDDDIADGDYTIRSDVGEGRSLGWEGDGNTNGQNVCLKDYFKNGDYVWTLERQSDDSFIVKTKQGGKLLDILGGPYSYGNEKNAIMWDYVQGNDNQRWYIVRNGSGYRFIAKHSGYSLDVRNGDATDGNNIYQYYPNESTAQRFYLEKHDFPNVEETSANDLKDNATYIIRSKLDVSKVITTELDSSGANGKNIYLYDYNSPNLPSTQIWKLEKQSDGTFLIKNTYNNKYMDVVWYSLSNRANIYSWERHYNPSESWYIVKNNDTEGTYRIVNKNSGKVVDITGGQTANGTNVQQYIWHEHPAQKFFFERVPATIEYTVTFKTDDNYIVSTQIVEEGNPAFAPQAPYREGYEFVDWEGDYSNILSDTVIIAKYNKLPENNNGINTGNNNNTATNTGSSSNDTANSGNNVVNNTGTNPSNGGNNTGGNLNIGNGNNIAGTNAGNTNSNTGNNIGNTATDTTKKDKGGSSNTANSGNNVVNNTGTSNSGNNTGSGNLNIGNGNNIDGTNAGNTNSNTGNNIGNTVTDTTKKSKGASSSGGGGSRSGGGGSRSGGGGGGGSRSGGGGGSHSGGSAAKASQNSISIPQGGISWQRDNKGWWIKNSDGLYPRNEWKLVNNSWYFFDSQGYMFTGWLNISGSWYFLNTDEGSNNGKMVTGWRAVSGKWYYLSTATDGSGGKMLLNTTIDGYRLGADGAWVK